MTNDYFGKFPNTIPKKIQKYLIENDGKLKHSLKISIITDQKKNQ